MGSSIRGETNVKFTKNRVKHRASDDMKLFAALTGLIAANPTSYYPSTTAAKAYDIAAALCTAMTDATKKATCVSALKATEAAIYTAAGYSKSSNNDLLMMMMMGGMGGAAGGANNMMLPLLLMDGGLGSSSSSNSNLLLPLMMMQQPQIDPVTGQSTGGMFGGAGGAAGGMDPLMMMLMLE